MGMTDLRVMLLLERMPDVDDDELDELTGKLRRRLLNELDLDVGNLRAPGPVPQNAKSAEVATAGALVLALSPVVLRSVLQLVQEWMKNRPLRTAKVHIGDDSIELTHLTSADQRRLVEAFIERHGAD